MRALSILLIAALLALTGCGDDDETPAAGAQQSTDAAMEKDTDDPAMKKGDEDAAMAKGERAKVTVGRSEFGEILFDANKQAIYIFENDPKGETVCYDECAEAWPPVFTDGEAVAGKGVKASMRER